MWFARLALLLPALFASPLSAAPVQDSDGSPATEVRYQGDRLTVTIENASPSEVLDALRRQTGADIRGGEIETAPVQQRFEQVPLRDALERYLGCHSFMLHYADGRLRSIDLLSSVPERPSTPAAVPAAAPSGVSTTPGAAMLGRPHPTWSSSAQALTQGRRAAPPAARNAGTPGPPGVAPAQPATGEPGTARRLGRPWPQAAFTTRNGARPDAASAMRGAFGR